MFRIGQGYDVHQYIKDKPLILGGITIPFAYGLLGHSDADVLTHAIMDAILGALALGDIGKFFPDTDDAFKGISSITLLHQVLEMMRIKQYDIINLDATLVMQKPKIRSYIDQIRTYLACEMNIDIQQINIKATTEEYMGFTGRVEGVKAYCTILLQQKNIK